MQVYPSRQIHDASKIIASAKGTRIPIKQLDAFTSGGMVYEDAEIKILWVQQLAQFGVGSLVDTHRVTVRKQSNEPWAISNDVEPVIDDSVVDWTVEYSDKTVFDYVELFSGDGDCLVYIPGIWVSHIAAVRETISTPFLLPRPKRRAS